MENKQSSSMAGVENFQYFMKHLQRKFRTKTLKATDFDVNIEDLSKNKFLNKKPDNDIDFELDFQNGEIKMTSFNVDNNNPSQRKPSAEEMKFRDKMNVLMTTFENETQNLDRKLEKERQLIQKCCQIKYEKELQSKQEYYNKTIKDLRNKIEELERDNDEWLSFHEQQKIDIEQFYLNKITEERNQMRDELQKKIIHAKTQEWQKTKI